MTTAPRPSPQPSGLWRRTPPAVFPPILGFLGLGLAWRAAGDGWQSAVGGLVLGAGVLLFCFAALAWLSKPLRRPGVVIEEMAVLPGRAGLAAMTLSAFAMAAALAPHAPRLALGLSVVVMLLHAGLAALHLRIILTGPAEARTLTPVWHLAFVGFIVGAVAWVQLGALPAARVVLFATLPVALGIWVGSLWQLVRRIPPAPLRPLLAIHLAPASLLATVAAGVGLPGLATLLASLAGAILVALLLAGRWITQSGFSPLWGAFTFPLAAFAGMLWVLVATGEPLRGLASIVLVAATLAIPPILVRILQLWARGDLAVRTNAATA
ncbi:MAG: SLAC1 family transporter [Alkalilacustris sp.]